jgi:2-dehydro-3-deoxyphosphogluconate aldolase/(4S)-4-hydroxy-2-oxoglutarate aldolase
MTRDQAKAGIEGIGILPGIRVESAEFARYCAETLYAAGIRVAEITMTIPGANDVIRDLVLRYPDMVVGAGTVLDKETADRCLDAGARFITSTGLIPEVIETVLKRGVVMVPGALTPTEVITAWKAGGDYVKVYPTAALGGEAYIRSLHLPLPKVPIIATGGVNQQTATNYILAGATAVGVGSELLPAEAVRRHQDHRIHELARRFIAMVKDGRQMRAAAQ